MENAFLSGLMSPDGHLMLFRWLHIYFGIIWIGLLYYFNFVQVPFFGEADGPTKSSAIQKLVPRALWWFRWGAMWTLAIGWIYVAARAHQVPGILNTSWGVSILTGGIIGTLMWFNVWFVIWPNQKIVIQNATDTAAGKPANPAAAGAGTRALVASRTNTLFSVPMLFFMAAASHLPYAISETSKTGTLAAVLGVILLAIEANALKGKVGPLATVKGVITFGFVLTAVILAVFAALI